MGEEKLNHAKLAEEVDRFHSILANSSDVVYRSNISTGQLEYISPSVISVLGFSPEEIMAMNIESAMEMIHPDDVHSVQSALETLGKDGRAKAEYRHKTKSGDYRWISNHLTLIRDSSGCELYRDGSIRDITEDKNLEHDFQILMNSVQEENARLSALVSSIPDEIWFADLQKQFTLANPSALREFGFESIDKLDIDAFAKSLEVLRPDGSPRPVDEAPTLLALEGETIHNQEEIIRTPATGELRYREVNAAPVIGPDGNIRGSVSVVRDITERKKVEEALKESEEKYHSLFSSMTEGFALCEIIANSSGKPIDYRIVETNRAWEELTGLTAATLIGKPLKEQIPDLEQYWIDAYGKVALTGEAVHLENYNRFTDNWYEIYAYSLQAGYFVTLVQNITERKKREEALHEREERFRILADNLKSGVALIDETGQFVMVNPSFLKLFGFSNNSTIFNVRSLDWSEWKVYQEDGETILDVDEHPVRKAALTGKPVKEMLVGVKVPRSEDLRWMIINTVPVFEKNGSIRYMVATYHDVTELKKAEQSLTSANEHLEQQVEERTRSLRAQVETTKRAESELRALSARIITAQEEERRDIARELHDEIGQALTALTFMFSRLKNSIPQELNPQIEAINRELSGVMSRVRSISKTLRPTVLDDLGLVPGLEWLFSGLKEQTGFQTDFDCPEIKILEPNICITAYRIIQESLTNVMRHSGVNSAVVKITKEDNYLRLCVTDYGRGFNTLEVPTSTGLSAMKERAKLVGGTVDLESTPGKGTVVTAQIPYK
ncbi:MAG: PAS domain S-box protein [Dehalogenimonas sp.]